MFLKVAKKLSYEPDTVIPSTGIEIDIAQAEHEYVMGLIGDGYLSEVTEEVYKSLEPHQKTTYNFEDIRELLENHGVNRYDLTQNDCQNLLDFSIYTAQPAIELATPTGMFYGCNEADGDRDVQFYPGCDFIAGASHLQLMRLALVLDLNVSLSPEYSLRQRLLEKAVEFDIINMDADFSILSAEIDRLNTVSHLPLSDITFGQVCHTIVNDPKIYERFHAQKLYLTPHCLREWLHLNGGHNVQPGPGPATPYPDWPIAFRFWLVKGVKEARADFKVFIGQNFEGQRFIHPFYISDMFSSGSKYGFTLDNVDACWWPNDNDNDDDDDDDDDDYYDSIYNPENWLVVTRSLYDVCLGHIPTLNTDHCYLICVPIGGTSLQNDLDIFRLWDCLWRSETNDLTFGTILTRLGESNE